MNIGFPRPSIHGLACKKDKLLTSLRVNLNNAEGFVLNEWYKMIWYLFHDKFHIQKVAV